MPSKHHRNEDADDSEDIDLADKSRFNPLHDADDDTDPNEPGILSSEDEYADVEPPGNTDNQDEEDDTKDTKKTTASEENSSNQTYQSPFQSQITEKQTEILFDLNDMEINQLLKQYLVAPIAPIPQEDHAKIQHIFTCPLLNPHATAGLTPEAENVAKDAGITDLLRLSRTHKENARINIHAVLKTCDLFIKHHQGIPLESEETDALHNGIVIDGEDGKPSTIQTYIPESQQLTASLKSAVAVLYKTLNPSYTNERNILLKTSAIQKSLEQPAHSITPTESKPDQSQFHSI